MTAGTNVVFVSSTSRDLALHRAAVQRTLTGIPGFQFVTMDGFGAQDASPEEYCRARVAACDVYLGVIGHRYGSRPPGLDLSFTEMEYEEARRLGRPRLMFLAPGSPPPDDDEALEDRQRQRAFRQRAANDRVYGEFTSPEDLAARVARALIEFQAAASARGLKRSRRVALLATLTGISLVAIVLVMRNPVQELGGTVMDVHGEPIAGAVVSLPDYRLTAHSSADGSFRLRVHARPAESVRIQVVKAGFPLLNDRATLGRPDVPLQLGPRSP